jgi:hypothetical protein
MARKKSLSCLEKRDLLNQPVVSLDELLFWGSHFEERGLIHDAMDFYEKAHDAEALDGLLRIALQDGDAFVFQRLCTIRGREPTADEWIALARKAEELGKDSFANKALKHASIEEQSAVV